MLNNFFKTTFVSSLTNLAKTTSIASVSDNTAKNGELYLFGGDSKSLTSLFGNKSLTSKDPTNTTYSTNGVTIRHTAGSHLESSITDASDVTMIAICRVVSTGITVVLGNLNNAGSTTSGAGVYTSGGKVYLNVRNPSLSLESGATIATDDYFAVAYSINKSTNDVILYVKDNNVEYSKTGLLTSSYLKTGVNQAVGNAVYTTGGGTIAFADALLFAKALTLDEIKSETAMLIEQANNRGIAV